MYISYDYYRVFYYVAKYGNITQAAKLMLNSQPNLTRTIKNLEAELGCALFSRSNQGMKLTPEGKRLYEHIKIAYEHIEMGEAEITDSRSLRSGSVYVAASEVALRCLLLPVLKKYRLRYPGIHIRISNHSTPQAIAALKGGTGGYCRCDHPDRPFRVINRKGHTPRKRGCGVLAVLFKPCKQAGLSFGADELPAHLTR